MTFVLGWTAVSLAFLAICVIADADPAQIRRWLRR
jgi:hypothetical protein